MKQTLKSKLHFWITAHVHEASFVCDNLIEMGCKVHQYEATGLGTNYIRMHVEITNQEDVNLFKLLYGDKIIGKASYDY